MKILVVDDIVVNRYIIKELLKGLGHTVIEAENGKIAIEKLNEDNIEMVFMDIEMPVMNGIETTQYIRTRMGSKAKTIVVALTAYTPSVLHEDFDTSVFNEVVTKPYTNEKIKAVIEKYISN
jgi:CheY-like chemotaxis protein